MCGSVLIRTGISRRWVRIRPGGGSTCSTMTGGRRGACGRHARPDGDRSQGLRPRTPPSLREATPSTRRLVYTSDTHATANRWQTMRKVERCLRRSDAALAGQAGLCLEVDHVAFEAVESLLHRLAQGGVGVYVAGQLLGGEVPLLGQGQLGQQLGDLGADQVAAEKLAVRGVADQLDEPGRVAEAV